MGNSEAKKASRSVSGQKEKEKRLNPLLVAQFQRMSQDGKFLTLDDFLGRFGELGQPLYIYNLGSAQESGKGVSVDRFHDVFTELLQSGSSIALCRLLLFSPSWSPDYDRLFCLLCSCANVSLLSGDETQLGALVRSLEKHCGKRTSAELSAWVEQFAPRILSQFQLFIRCRLLELPISPDKTFSGKSEILSPFQLWFLHCSLPHFYTSRTSGSISDSNAISPSGSEDHDSEWEPLFRSSFDGLSTSRFLEKVLGYREASVCIMRLAEGTLVALGVDEEWRLGSKQWGSVNCVATQLLPEFNVLDRGPGLLYFNLKLRGSPTGFRIGSDTQCPKISVEPDFSNVSAIEVFGCGSSQTLAKQKEQKQWEKRQVEKQKKVPLPGNWDENPDKVILEMAGKKFFSDKNQNM